MGLMETHILTGLKTLQNISGGGVDINNQVYCPDFPVGIKYQNFENWNNLFLAYVKAGLVNENTTIIAHSIAPVFVCKFLVLNKIKVKKLIFVCGFNNYFGISPDYDFVNKTMFFDDFEKVKDFADEIVCFYSDNDPYVDFVAEKEFADKISNKQILLKGAGHINSESGFDNFDEIKKYL